MLVALAACEAGRPAPTLAPGSAEPAAVATGAASAQPQQRSCSGSNVDLTWALRAEQCLVPIADPPRLRPWPQALTIALEPEAESVAAGGRLLVRVVFRNTGASRATLLLRPLVEREQQDARRPAEAGELSTQHPFSLWATDEGGRPVGSPRNGTHAATLGLISSWPPAATQIHIAPGGHAVATSLFRATGYDPDEDDPDADRPPPVQPLEAGVYHLTLLSAGAIAEHRTVPLPHVTVRVRSRHTDATGRR